MSAQPEDAIGMLDSGLGGVTVLARAHRLLPAERFVYLADLAHSPWGGRRKEELVGLIDRSVEVLLARGVKALVLASNTGTSAAAESLRDRLDIPVVGMEPALKPAVLAARGGRILVLATELTLREGKFQALYQQYRDEAPIVLKSCPGLVELIDRGVRAGPRLDEYLAGLLREVAALPIAVVVLGCTHYLIVQGEILKHLDPRAVCLDGNEGVSRQIKNLLGQRSLLRAEGAAGEVELLSSDPARQGLLAECWRELERG